MPRPTLSSRLRNADLFDPALWALFASILLLAQLAAYYARIYHYNVVDDAYISFQYAKNLSLGRGLVFNPGERVEGYTNFLWVVTLAPLYPICKLLHADFTRTAISFNIIIALVDLALLYLIGRRWLTPGWVATALALVICALDNSYQGYAMSGFENHMVMLWELAAVFVWLGRGRRRAYVVGLFLALANMTRPDAGLFMAAFVVANTILLIAPRIEGQKRGPRALSILQAFGTWLVVFGLYFAWRYHYYGWLLPNTFYLKAGGHLNGIERGWAYARSFLEDRYYLPVAMLLALRWAHRPIVLWLVIFLLCHFVYVIYVGGDFYSGHRFYVALLPFIYLLIARTVHGIVQSIRGLRAWRKWVRPQPAAPAITVAVTAGAVAYFLFLFTIRGFERGPYTGEYTRWSAVVDNNVRYMRWLSTIVHPGESMVLGDIGAAGFFPDLVVYDMLGVIDPKTAHQTVPNFGRGKAGHEKYASREYLMSRKPTYIKYDWLRGDFSSNGYYLFTDFPADLEVDGLWAREDLTNGHFLPSTAIHFDASQLSWWSPSGSAFDHFPCTSAPRGQYPPFGPVGSYINTFTAERGDNATGRLLSPLFPLLGDKMILRVGGGRDLLLLRVSLVIDDQAVFSATGHDREVLGRRVWDISTYNGKQALLEIVDEATGRWGHILVDEVVQWQQAPAPVTSSNP